MNRLREFKQGNEVADEFADRRNGIKLVTQRTPSPFRIEIADDMFARPLRSERTGQKSISNENHNEAGSKAIAALVAAAAVTATGLVLWWHMLKNRRD